jgi:hypothetical protein
LKIYREDFNSEKHLLGELSPDSANLVEWISKKILGKVTETTEYGIEQQIHDLIIKNVRYVNTESRSEHTIEGVFLNKQAVCEGIAKAVKFLLNKKSVECEIVTGNAKLGADEEHHAWNVVKIDGAWYHLDVTWNLNLTTNETIRYDYFNLSDDEIQKDHNIDHKFVKCETPRSCYYYRNNLVMHTQEKYREFVLESVRKNRNDFVIKLPSAKNPEQVYKTVMDNTLRILNHPFSPYSRVNVEYNPHQLVFRVILS